MYKAIERFRDKTDNHIYEINNEFPFDGRRVAKKRLEELLTDKNDGGKPLIEKIEIEENEE